jgi:AraC family transcriptional regulator of arabinose operon
VYTPEGFAGQRLHVLPRPLVAEASRRPVTSRLIVTDCGYFPNARNHGRSRPEGTAEAIVILCTEGRGVCTLGDADHPVEAGDALVIPAGLAHTYRADSHRPWSIWWLHLAGEDVPELLQAMQLPAHRPVMRVGDMFRAASLVDETIRRLETDDSVSSLIASAGSAWHLAALLAADQRPASARPDPVVKARERLQQQVGLRVSVADLASEAGLSQSHFSALFKRSTGYGVLEYQTRLRMARARELLDTTELALSAVAHDVGYDDPLYFSRQFRRIHGINPSGYRKHAKG